MKRIIWVLIVGLVIGLVGCAGQEVDSRQKIVDSTPLSKTEKPIDPEVAELIKQLGNEDFKARDSAQKELTEWGEQLIEQYRQTKSEAGKKKIAKLADALRQGCQDKDPEIKSQANHIRQRLRNLVQPKIAFTVFTGRYLDLFVIDANGQNLTRLTKSQAHDTSHTWSPDDTRIAFQSKIEYQSNICVVDANGKNMKKLTDNNAYNSTPVWSPDGTRIIFSSNQDGKSNICIMDADGKDMKRLTNNNAYNNRPVWSPDGAKIAFASDQSGKFNIYVMDADGKNQLNLAKGSVDGISPAWSPDGAKIVFLSPLNEAWELYTMDATGMNLKRLTYGRKPNNAPVWNPNSTKIAFHTHLNNKWNICVVDADGKNRKNLTIDMGTNNTFPTWSPDGTQMAFQCNKWVYIMEANGKNQKKLAEGGLPVWSQLSLKEISVLFADKEK